MSLFQEWEDLISNQTEETVREFWEKYSTTERSIYSKILDDYKTPVKGVFKELVETFEADPIIFMGFLDGINTSIEKEQDLDSITEESPIELVIDYEKLYYNMHAAEADYLYNLPQWEEILTEEKRMELAKAYKRSKTIVKEKEPGRNDPCPCGSGKKYKKCCGKDK